VLAEQRLKESILTGKDYEGKEEDFGRVRRWTKERRLLDRVRGEGASVE